jgi:transcriptional regulator with XRE-family HTH domain
MRSRVSVPDRFAPVRRAFGRALKDARSAKGLSQTELAEEAGVNSTYPSLLERGLRAPTLGMMIELADACGITCEELLRRTLRRLNT